MTAVFPPPAANIEDGTAIGQVVYWDGTDYVPLANGTAGQLLTSNGAAAAPSWTGGGGALPAPTAANTTLRSDGSGWVENTVFRIPADGEPEVRGPGTGDLTMKFYGGGVLSGEFGIDAGEDLIIQSRAGVAAPDGKQEYVRSADRWDWYAGGNTAGQKRLEVSDTGGVLARRGTLGVRTPAGFEEEAGEWETFHVRTTDAANNDIVVALGAVPSDQKMYTVQVTVQAARDTGNNFFYEETTYTVGRTGGAGGFVGGETGVSKATGTGASLLVTPVLNVTLRLNGNAGEQWEWTIMVRRQEAGFTS